MSIKFIGSLKFIYLCQYAYNFKYFLNFNKLNKMNILKVNLNDQLKNNYIFLPKEYIESHLLLNRNIVTIIKLKKINTDEIIFLGWMGGTSSREGLIEISSPLGRSLNIHSGEYLKIIQSPVNLVSEEDSGQIYLEHVELEPLTNYDYKIIENNASFFEENLLNQIMVVYDGLIFPFVFFDNKVACLRVKLEDKNKGKILSQDCEVRVAYVAPVKEEESKINYFLSKNKILRFAVNDFPLFSNSVSIKISKKSLMEIFHLNEKTFKEDSIKNHVINISFSREENENKYFLSENILFRLSDKSSINNFYNTVEKYKKSTSKEELDLLIENNFINKFPYKSNIWINLIIDEFSNDTKEMIFLEEYLKMNTILYDNDKVDLFLFNIDFINQFNEKLYIDFICSHLSIDYFILNFGETETKTDDQSSQSDIINLNFENLIRKEFINFLTHNESLFLNLDFIYKFSVPKYEVIFKLNFIKKQMKDYAELLAKLKINFNKFFTNKETNPPHFQPFIYFGKFHLRIIELMKMNFNNELNIIYNYNFSNKSYRNLFSKKEEKFLSNLQDPLEDKNLITNMNLDNFNSKIINNDIEKNKISDKLKLFFKNRNSIGVSIISFPKEYDTKLFLSKMYSKIISNQNRKITKLNKPIYVYVNLDIFNFNSYQDIKIFEEYLKNLFNNYTISENNFNTKVIFIFEGLERFKKLESGAAVTNQLQSQVNNSFSYLMTKFINKCNKKNQNSENGNLFYIILCSSGGIVDNIPIDYLSKNILFNIEKINFIEKSKIIEILKFLLEKNNIKLPQGMDIDKILEELSEFSKNFVLSDFQKIQKKLSNIEWGKNSNENSLSLFSQILSSYIPLNIVEEKIIKLGNDFSNVGGMNKIKEEIYDTIVLSMKCSEIFGNKLPIKMSSGILLVGPPGCGKTLIASALQREFKMNFFSVKGPEILNKYIGASEAAVREIFERAKKTIPCVVFFDEFDSLAPKRGSGSSGVTDRIVNQLLTYLDGIESREGIFVVGASSRPDLIDPAVLRPGRLDKIILCDFPNKTERFDILKLYYQKAHQGQINEEEKIYDKSESFIDTQLKINIQIEDVLLEIAEDTQYFTGADLQSLIYNAFLLAVKRNISLNLDSHASISHTDILQAFKDFKRSVSEKDIKFYEEIKDKFSSRLGINNYEKEITTEKMKDLNENQLKTTLY
jgi:SpoVK/Ycf46/Vps4 family AAA+-type ATPase